MGGPDAYWQSFRYDPVGNRTKQTDYGTGALAGADATTTYTHNNPSTGLPHAVQSATVSGGVNDGQTSSFHYDAAGNTIKRTIGATTQDLTWDDEGRLATLTESGKTTSYQYDADGNRLITKDADGTQTLTLPGNNELKIKADGTKEGIRYYTHEGQTVAVRTSSGFSFLLPDQQGTAMAAVAMTTLAVTRRKQLPFGQLRSQQTETIPGTRGFVGGTADPTGLIHLGAREYDPVLGQFLSVDPVINLDNPGQMNGYSYAHNAPVTASDPTGECATSDCPTRNCPYCLNRTPTDKNPHSKALHDRPGSGSTPNNTKAYAKKYAKQNKADVYAASHYDANAAAKRAKTEAGLKAQAIAQAKAAQAERRKKDGIFGNIMKGNWGSAWKQTKSGLHDTFGTWDGWKNRVIPGLGLVACAFATAGGCTLIGLGAVAGTFIGEGAMRDNWDWKAAAKGAIWTLAGGAVAGGLAAKLGGVGFREGLKIPALARYDRIEYVGKATYGYRNVVDFSGTLDNVSVNVGLSMSFCGAGGKSTFSTVGLC